jgi:hypothetical protein
MAEQNIYQRVLEIPESFKDRLSDDDLIAVVENRENNISEQGMRIINQGRAARGGLSEALDVVGSVLGGAVSGAAGGLVAGPVGAIVGGITGGAVGAGAGSIIEDIRDDRELDAGRAIKEAAISAGTDAVTLGAFRIVKPIANRLGTSAIKMFKGSNPSNPMPNRILDLDKATPESLRQTAEMGVELSAYQASQAGTRVPRWRLLFEDLGEIGLFSKGVAESRKQRNFELIKDRMIALAGDVAPDNQLTNNQLGRQVYDVITAGKAAMESTYGKGLESLIAKTNNKVISTKNIKSSLSDLLSQTRKPGDPLIPQIQNFLTKKIEDVAQIPDSMNARQLLDFRTLLNRELDDLIIDPKTLQPDRGMQRQAAEINKKIREGIEKTFGEFGPEARREAARINTNYASALKKIMPPKISRAIITTGAEKNYKDIGQLLSKVTDDVDSESVSKFMRSIDESFRQMDRASIQGPVKSAQDVKKAIRSGFLYKQFGDITSLQSLDSFKPLINDFSNADKVAYMKSVLGESYKPYKSYVNAIYEATKENERGFLSLGLKSRELAAATAPFQIAGGAFSLAGGTELDFQAGASEISTAGAIFLAPIVMAKIAANPKAVNRLIGLHKQANLKGKDIGGAAVTSSAIKIINELSEQDRREISEELSFFTQ